MRSDVPPLEAAIIGPGAQKFWDQFESFRVGNFDQFAPTWNWGGFWLVGFWFLYRKLYTWGAILIGVSLLTFIPYIGPFIGLALIIFSAIISNYLYYLHVKKQAEKIRNSAIDENEAVRIAQQIGGVNIWAIWVFAGYLVITLMVGFIAGYTGI